MTTETALREKLNEMADQLQIFEMSAGWRYTKSLPLYQEYQVLMDEYEKLTGHRNHQMTAKETAREGCFPCSNLHPLGIAPSHPKEWPPRQRIRAIIRGTYGRPRTHDLVRENRGRTA